MAESSLQRMVEIIELIAKNRSQTYPKQIVEDLRAPPSSIYELLHRLVEAGLLNRCRDGGLRLGDKLYAIGMARFSLSHAAAEIPIVLRSLRDHTQETAYLSVLEGDRVLVMHVFRSARSVRSIITLGAELPVNWDACGRVLLSGMDTAGARAIVARASRFSTVGLPVINISRFLAEIADASRRGHALESHSIAGGTSSIAAPVLGVSGTVVAAVGLVLPTTRMMHTATSLTSLVISSAQEISLTQQRSYAHGASSRLTADPGQPDNSRNLKLERSKDFP
jgi:DNA-binding IclR family transcriptional regulator